MRERSSRVFCLTACDKNGNDPSGWDECHVVRADGNPETIVEEEYGEHGKRVLRKTDDSGDGRADYRWRYEYACP